MNAKLAKEKAKKADQRNKGKNGNDIVYNLDFILKLLIIILNQNSSEGYHGRIDNYHNF